MRDMGMLDTLLRKAGFSVTDAAIIAVVLVATVNALCEFWAWIGQP